MPPRCLPDASQMPPRCIPDASQMLPSSPLTLDVPQVDPTRFRGQSDISIFCVLENEGRNNCKMLLKMGFQWMHKCVKCGQIVKRSMKIKGPNNLRMEMTKQVEIAILCGKVLKNQALEGLYFTLFRHFHTQILGTFNFHASFDDWSPFYTFVHPWETHF